MDKAELNERLQPKHLDVAAMKTEVEKAIIPDKPEEKPKDDPKSNESYPFTISWKAPNGKLWEGKFVNRILNVGQRQMVGILRAKMCDGVPYNSLDDMTNEINLMLSHLAISLTEKPEWADRLENLVEIALVQEIYMEVLSHEAFFRGSRSPIADS